MFIFKEKKERGFTLIEALVAVSVFSISIVTLLSVLGSGIANTNHAKRKVTATYLAQEGVEFMRNMRDTYMLYNTGTGWASFQNRLTVANCTPVNGNGCYYNDNNLSYTDQSQPIADSLTVPLTSCGSTCTGINYNSTTGKYGYGTGGSWTSSGFVRKINATIVNANEVRITSTVTWTKGGFTYTSVLSEYLFNWID